MVSFSREQKCLSSLHSRTFCKKQAGGKLHVSLCPWWHQTAPQATVLGSWHTPVFVRLISSTCLAIRTLTMPADLYLFPSLGLGWTFVYWCCTCRSCTAGTLRTLNLTLVTESPGVTSLPFKMDVTRATKQYPWLLPWYLPPCRKEHRSIQPWGYLGSEAGMRILGSGSMLRDRLVLTLKMPESLCVLTLDRLISNLC